MPEKIKRLRVLAGPNGSGKSTVVFHILGHYHCGYFLNADKLHERLEKSRAIELSDFDLHLTPEVYQDYLSKEGQSWIAKAGQHHSAIQLFFESNQLKVRTKAGGYDAALAADFLRHQLLKQDSTFTFETVLSDFRKIVFLQQAIEAGFKIYLYFICTKDPEINKARVANRVKLGGHDVPVEKIVSRYYSSLQILEDLVPLTHRCFLFDNSEEGGHQEINLVAEIEHGNKLTIHSHDVPLWMQQHVIDKLF